MTEKIVKILLAEDDKFIARAYTDGLQRAGFKILLAVDGSQVLEILQNELPDLILLDIIMPEKNGFEVLEEIKKQDKLKNIPVIILSNLGQDTDIQKGLKLGAIDYMIKANFSIAEVIKKIQHYIEENKKNK